MSPVAVVSLGQELTDAAVMFAAGVALGTLAHALLELVVRLGDEAVWIRSARLVRGAGLALALVAAGRWAAHRWAASIQRELDVVLIAVAIMLLWEAGGFTVNVRSLRAPRVRLPDPPTGAGNVEPLPARRFAEADVEDVLSDLGKLKDASSGD